MEPGSILTKCTLIRMTLVCVFRLIITLWVHFCLSESLLNQLFISFTRLGLLSDLWDLRAAHTKSQLVLLQDVQFEKVFEFALHSCRFEFA